MDQLTFSGYGSGQVDFQLLLDTTTQDDLVALNEFINRIVTQLIAQDPAVKIIFTIVGLSDKNDDSNLSCDARRVSERDASRKRMQSFRKWIFRQIKQRAAANDVDVTTADRSWLTEFGIAGMTAYLVNPNPTTEAQRRDNRCVTILFKEYPLPPEAIGAVALEEPTDDEAWLAFA